MRAEVLYRALLYCYPAPFRHEYGDQMALAFSEQLSEAQRAGSPARTARVWLDAALDALVIAPKEHGHVILQDLRYAARMMRANPGFTAVAILSLALGIGVNTAIFSLWDGILRSALPGVERPEQLVILTDPGAAGGWNGNETGDRHWLTYAEFEQLRDNARSFSGMLASQSFLDQWQVRYEHGGWEEANGRLVSGEYFEVLGTRPVLGRLFSDVDDRAAWPYAVISHNYWLRRFGGMRDVLGKTFTLRNATLTIIGVTAPGFLGETIGQQPDVWVPMHMQRSVRPWEDLLHDQPPSKRMWLHVFGRLKPGVAASQAGAEANAIFQAGLESFYGAVTAPDRRREYLDQRLKIQPGARGASETRAAFSTSLTALLAAVGLLLLIACANLASLLVARGAARRTEMALRLSLGASRGRLVRQLVTESAALALLGGLAGLAAAHWFHAGLTGMIAESDPDFRMSFALDAHALLFTLAITVATAVLFGLLPAWQMTSAGPGSSLREHSRGAVSGPGQVRWGRYLVSVQLALSVPLLTGAGLLAKTLYHLQHVDLGYPSEHRLQFGVNTREAGYSGARSEVLFLRLLTEFRAIPGVTAASFSNSGLFTGSSSGAAIEVEGSPATRVEQERGVAYDIVGPDYFSTLGVPILLGRGILESDDANATKVCVINESFAKHLLAGRNPIGVQITSMDDERRKIYNVVGVVKDLRSRSLREPVVPQFYTPAEQPPGNDIGRANFLIRTAGGVAPVVDAVRQILRKTDASLPMGPARLIEEQIVFRLTAQDRSVAELALVFACTALALAAAGLYGVLSYSVARRTGEIAVRMALGAQRAGVVAMILRETMGTVMTGLLLGSVLAYAGTRLIESRLYGVSTQDPVTLTLAAGLLLGAALSAAYLPARRAAALDPMTALRQE